MKDVKGYAAHARAMLLRKSLPAAPAAPAAAPLDHPIKQNNGEPYHPEVYKSLHVHMQNKLKELAGGQM